MTTTANTKCDRSENPKNKGNKVKDAMLPKRRKDPRAAAVSSKRSASFDEFFTGVYGARWPALRKALASASPKKVVLWNRFCQLPFEKVMKNMTRVDDDSPLQVFHTHDSSAEVMPPASDEFNVKAYYVLDYMSALVVEQLDVTSFDNVLDLCAAPGGKSIAIAQFLSIDGTLTVNQHNSGRCARLQRSIRDYIPSNYVPVTITQRSSEAWYAPSTYHRVLVDPPCSAERYLLQNSGAAPVSSRDWTEQMSLALSHTQAVSLLRAIETCRVGGRVVYTTSSISPRENDGVVEDALRRTRCGVEVQPSSSSSLRKIGEKTQYGHIVLPDTAGGLGPMFCCVIHKLAERRGGGDGDTDDDDDCEEESDNEGEE